MKASKKHKVIRKGDPLFEKLKSQMRPDIAKGLKSITLIKPEYKDEWDINDTSPLSIDKNRR